LAPFSPTPTSSNTAPSLIALHYESNGYFPLFFKDYEPNQDLELSSNSFKLAFQCMPHLSMSGPFGMVFQHLQIIFTQKIQQVDSFNYFNFVFIFLKVTFHLELHMFLAWPTF
jgi:hypothetical protein